ncbi:hypothetical protein ES708_26353 [subsurface metagenome]
MTDKMAELRAVLQGLSPAELRLVLLFKEFLAEEQAKETKLDKLSQPVTE